MGFSKWHSKWQRDGMHKAFFSLLTQRLSLRGWLALYRLAIISAYLPACSSFLPGFHSYPSDPGPIKVKLYFTLHSPLPITHPLVNEDFRGWALGDTRCGTIGVFFFWTLLPHPHSFLLCCCCFFFLQQIVFSYRLVSLLCNQGCCNVFILRSSKICLQFLVVC